MGFGWLAFEGAENSMVSGDLSSKPFWPLGTNDVEAIAFLTRLTLIS
jgi:hypothetical protein